LILGFFLIFAGVTFYYLKDLKSRDDVRVEELRRNMEESQKIMLGHISTVTNQINKSVNESQRNLGERLDNAAKVVNSVTSKLSVLEENNKRIYDIGKDISSLQQILQAPKLRGQLGELFLENLLKDRFTSDQYAMQHRFKSGETVDAVIKLRDGKLVPIDAKFPLENFKKMIQAGHDEDSKKKARKLFKQDLKNRIDEIAKKYILADEGTLEFALMYIPAENVYYEVVIQDSEDDGPGIMQYAFEKNVFPVSPNTFAIYLTTILNGLRGLEIEKKASEIMAGLSRLHGDFDKFNEDFRLVGTHLGRAKNSFELSERKLGRLGDKISTFGNAKVEENLLLD